MTNYITGNYEAMETHELLAELSHAEQLGYEMKVYELKMEIEVRFSAPKEEVQAVAVTEVETAVINVTFDYGYKWTVYIEGEEESRDSYMTKKDAMRLARQLKKGFQNAIVNEQKLSRKEKAENIKWLHENTDLYEFQR